MTVNLSADEYEFECTLSDLGRKLVPPRGHGWVLVRFEPVSFGGRTNDANALAVVTALWARKLEGQAHR